MHGWKPSTVTRELTMHLAGPDLGSLAVPVVVHYDADDPYAVHATFRTGDAAGVTWVFDRGMLADGLHGPSGEGDVHIVPTADTEIGTDVVVIALMTDEATAIFQAEARPLGDFLADTYLLCPHGAESAFLDVDGAIEALLAA
ncbi:MAG: SsgA family sporulation/cell division regulator [Actinomycetes bacterium]